MPGLASKKEKKTQQNGAETGAERAGGGRKVKLDKANGAKGERERERERKGSSVKLLGGSRLWMLP